MLRKPLALGLALVIGAGGLGVSGCTSRAPAMESVPSNSDDGPPTEAPTESPGAATRDVRAEALHHIHHYQTIALTREQREIRTKALSQIPAPCCSNYTAATCCCECNLARTIWGLSNRLIVQGADVAEVQEAAREWIRTVNPTGFTGDACFTGGCSRAFDQNGCGGMSDRQLT